MGWKYELAAMRYTLVVRGSEFRRVAVLNTPRSLVDLNGLLGSLFRSIPDATVIDVVQAGKSIDEQEIIVSAERYSGEGAGRYVWYKSRDLRAIEADLSRSATRADLEPEVMA